MGKRINPRLVNWILILIVLGAVFYFGRDGEAPKPEPPTLNQAVVRSDFLEMTGIPQPKPSQLGGRYYATEILLPDPFPGKPGTKFYVRMEDGHEAITALYEIEKVTGPPLKATYRAVKSYDAQYKPAGTWKRINLTGAAISGT